MAGRVVLETARLLLREFDEGDAEAFYPLGSHPEIIRYTGDPGLTSVEHAREVLLASPIADYAKHGYGRWACVFKETGAVIGFAGLKYLDDLKEVDIGYRLLPAFWGRGLATEAGRASLDYGFDHLRLGHIIGLVEPENVASVRILEKLGLTLAGPIDFRGDEVDRYVITTAARYPPG